MLAAKMKTHNRSNETVNIGSILLVSFAVSLFVPPAAPVISIALIAGGVTLHRNSEDSSLRGIAWEAIAGGVILLVTVILIVFLTFSVRTIASN